MIRALGPSASAGLSILPFWSWLLLFMPMRTAMASPILNSVGYLVP